MRLSTTRPAISGSGRDATPQQAAPPLQPAPLPAGTVRGSAACQRQKPSARAPSSAQQACGGAGAAGAASAAAALLISSPMALLALQPPRATAAEAGAAYVTLRRDKIERLIVSEFSQRLHSVPSEELGQMLDDILSGSKGAPELLDDVMLQQQRGQTRAPTSNNNTSNAGAAAGASSRSLAPWPNLPWQQPEDAPQDQELAAERRGAESAQQQDSGSAKRGAVPPAVVPPSWQQQGSAAGEDAGASGTRSPEVRSPQLLPSPPSPLPSTQQEQLNGATAAQRQGEDEERGDATAGQYVFDDEGEEPSSPTASDSTRELMQRLMGGSALPPFPSSDPMEQAAAGASALPADSASSLSATSGGAAAVAGSSDKPGSSGAAAGGWLSGLKVPGLPSVPLPQLPPAPALPSLPQLPSPQLPAWPFTSPFMQEEAGQLDAGAAQPPDALLFDELRADSSVQPGSIDGTGADGSGQLLPAGITSGMGASVATAAQSALSSAGTAVSEAAREAMASLQDAAADALESAVDSVVDSGVLPDRTTMALTLAAGGLAVAGVLVATSGEGEGQEGNAGAAQAGAAGETQSTAATATTAAGGDAKVSVDTKGGTEASAAAAVSSPTTASSSNSSSGVQNGSGSGGSSNTDGGSSSAGGAVASGKAAQDGGKAGPRLQRLLDNGPPSVLPSSSSSMAGGAVVGGSDSSTSSSDMTHSGDTQASGSGAGDDAAEGSPAPGPILWQRSASTAQPAAAVRVPVVPQQPVPIPAAAVRPPQRSWEGGEGSGPGDVPAEAPEGIARVLWERRVGIPSSPTPPPPMPVTPLVPASAPVPAPAPPPQRRWWLFFTAPGAPPPPPLPSRQSVGLFTRPPLGFTAPRVLPAAWLPSQFRRGPPSQTPSGASSAQQATGARPGLEAGRGSGFGMSTRFEPEGGAGTMAGVRQARPRSAAEAPSLAVAASQGRVANGRSGSASGGSGVSGTASAAGRGSSAAMSDTAAAAAGLVQPFDPWRVPLDSLKGPMPPSQLPSAAAHSNPELATAVTDAHTSERSNGEGSGAGKAGTAYVSVGGGASGSPLLPSPWDLP